MEQEQEQRQGRISLTPEQTNVNYIYMMYRKTPSDINEHLITLAAAALKSNKILELGTRAGISTVALMWGLSKNEEKTNSKKTIYCVDPQLSGNANILSLLANQNDIQIFFSPHLSINFVLPEEVDVLFIDSMHCYGILKRELERFHKQVRRQIIMHDTSIDGEVSELIRCKSDVNQVSNNLNIPQTELEEGLNKAIQEFLIEYPEWTVTDKFINNNGLTVLTRLGIVQKENLE